MPDEPDFATFTHDDSWRLGSALVAMCRAESLPVTISIHLGEQRAFHAALPGTSADNDAWAMRKTRVVRHFDRSSHEVGQAYVGADPALFHAAFGLPAGEYAPTGGAVPIRVQGAMVGVLAVSGLASIDDHQRALGALRTAATAQASPG
ncbi:heme-degrading domain-containing protein [Microlunatus antarcticus]|uniref:Uncharacterized protein (UPF0303 family) n=1 Tax=Microlunatus antarcticus TaxID=53388 RepID=A0A7W5JUE9_9ACTN|nr:uncharacterized protein (UPF0303 family) [Microlunatus antarcticus]